MVAWCVCVCIYIYTHYIAKSIGSPPSNEQVFGDEFLAQGLHLQSHQRC